MVEFLHVSRQDGKAFICDKKTSERFFGESNTKHMIDGKIAGAINKYGSIRVRG